ncbi:uncharacterized protein LOC131876594 [Cryptomeria japonica]|uniref:uncharacterized protein LOC131876594 n=1 Tax=Cryptomeria japonica TaxID=3369 RepID=UPI0027DA7D18|nr:uncharacterized protein LOC131876594 [Cryptomeria japonica]
MIVWAIWKERNKRIFKELAKTVELVINDIKASIEEVIYGRSRNVSKFKFNDWDMEMERNWSLKNALFHYPKNRINRKEVRWEKPQNNWVKLNFDGACRGNPGQAGFGAVIRNKEGNVVSGTYGYIGHATNNEAKIRALEVGLLLCKEIGLTNIQVEGDSQIIINGVTNDKLLNWKLSKWLLHIHSLLQAIKPYEITHILREGNKVADLLANLGVNSQVVEVTVIPMALSPEVTDLCRKDLWIRKTEGVG